MEAYTETQLQLNREACWQKRYYDKAISTVQLMPGDVVLMKADTLQGKRKVKDQWIDVEYIMVHQVTDDMLAYEVCDEGRNLKAVHQNRLFLVATLQSDATPLD